MTILRRQRLCRPPKALATSLLLSNLILFSTVVLAETYTLTVKVTVVEKTCDIYGDGGIGQPITVNMGDLIIKNINGVDYGKTDIPYTLDCEDAASNPALKLKFDGPQMGGQAGNVLSTSDPNLGLRLMADNSNLNLATWRNFNYNTKPALSVIPVGSGTGGINDGQMAASATLSVEYQ
ncbi:MULTISPECIES: fimbrial protein [unclassified Providencia]|uniref:fimbrial protein n=1 Tax=unclassified Providencia TaxID=2633465 RepID=UPI0023499273|nr:MULTISPECIES: fimbrial protein [unclassified Providencia]